MPTPAILPEQIAAEQPVIHPALDWRNDVLLMGALLTNERRCVLTSLGQLLDIEQLESPICDRARNFSRSPVTPDVARRFQENYGAPGNLDSAYALVNVPTRLSAYYRRFIVFPEPWWPDVLAVWTLGTYLYPLFSAYPYIRISSPEPGCGKSLLGQVIANLSFNGELMVSPTEANIFRLAESERGTQVWDEVENLQETDRNRLQVMMGVLLNGYRSGANVPRQERVHGGQFTTVRFHVYVPRVLIGLSELPPLIQQRVIELTLHRRGPEEQVERYNPGEREQDESELRAACALYALTYCNAATRQYRREDLRRGLERNLRQAGRLPDDLLLPLLAVSAAPLDRDSRSRDVVLPILRTMFEQAAPALSRTWNEGTTSTPQWFVAALDLLEQLGELEPAELSDLITARTGTNFSPEQMSRQLRRYGIRSGKSGGRRVFSVPASELSTLRRRYRIASTEVELLSTVEALPASTSGQ